MNILQCGDSGSGCIQPCTPQPVSGSEAPSSDMLFPLTQAHCTPSPGQPRPGLPLPSCIFASRPLLPDGSGIPALSLPGLDLTAGLTAAIPGDTHGDGGAALLWSGGDSEGSLSGWDVTRHRNPSTASDRSPTPDVGKVKGHPIQTCSSSSSSGKTGVAEPKATSEPAGETKQTGEGSQDVTTDAVGRGLAMTTHDWQGMTKH